MQFFTARKKLVPLRRSLEADFDHLMRISDIVPAPIRLPTFGNNLHERATERSFGDVRDAVAIRFDVQLDFLVLLDDMFFDVFDVDARVLNGNSFLAAGDFDR